MSEFAFRRQWGPAPKYLRVQNYVRPNQDPVFIAGPCSVESKDQIWELAEIVSRAGATHLRGGVFRAGTYPGQNFGLIDRSLIADFSLAAKKFNLKNIIEVLDYSEHMMDKIAPFASCFQIGARAMQNYTLLRNIGAYGKPVFLKRHPGATLDEWLGAAEHVLAGGVRELYLIERGSVSHASHVRWDLSVSMIPAAKAITQIPVLVDGSHGTGRRDLVSPMTLAGIAAGADGCLVEVHREPAKSLSDADQAITPEAFQCLMKKIQGVRSCIA